MRPKTRRSAAGKTGWLFIAVFGAVAVVLAAGAQLTINVGPERWTFEIAAIYPHDTGAFTQGLAVHNGSLYEGTGQYGASTLRRVDLVSGRIEKSTALSNFQFGEGITVLQDKIYQLTWQNNLVFIYDVATFERLGTLRNEGEGWGLTTDGARLIVSDGTSSLRFHDPETFAETGRVAVRSDGQPVSRINELEFVNGEIWANIWYQDQIARISAETGEVLGWIDLSGLNPSRSGSEDVLNGIAYDSESDRLFVTGKNWASLYEIEVGPR